MKLETLRDLYDENEIAKLVRMNSVRRRRPDWAPGNLLALPLSLYERTVNALMTLPHPRS